ncbi:MAG TPA: glycosyltransferase family 4 protein [Polyangia bacterium]|nr:glycosyltransferase family 4 protein [Polyangia bacterium]
MPEARRRILSTLFGADPPMAVWQERTDMLRPREKDAATIAAVVSRAGRYDAVVLDGSARRDQVAAALVRRLPRHPAIVIADSTWKAGGGLDTIINRTGIRMIDGPRTSFVVASSFEAESFPRTWRLRSSRVRFVPWAVTIKDDRPSTDNGRVFAGGNSLRDYGPLIAAAGAIDAPVDIATSAVATAELGPTPSNLTIGPQPQAEYDEMLRAAAVVVVPLLARADRSSGQTTYVNAMARGKAIVVTDTPGVRDYITDGETGLIVAPGDTGAMAQAVRRLLADPDERARLGRQARAHALGALTLTHYATQLLGVVDETLSGPAPRR